MSTFSRSARGISAAAIMAILAGASYAELPEALKATKSQGFDNQSAVSAVLGGTVLGYSGDAGAYLRARENAANYATTLGGGGMYSGDQLLNPTADWSIAVSAKLATDKANGIIWSTGRAALASGIKKGLALLENDDGSVKLVHWVVGENAEVILSGTVTDGTTRYHSYIVTHAYTAATEEPESVAQSTYTLYIDGVQAATATGAAYECDENGYQFGRVHGAIPTGATEGVGIMLDEVGVWTDKVLSAADAKAVADELPVWPGAIGEITLPTGDVNWSDVEKPETLGDSNEITLQGDTTLTLGGAVDLKNVVLKGTGTLLIADPENLTLGGLEKAAGTDFGFVIDATAGVTADETIKGYIQNTDYKLVIKGEGENGLTADFGLTANFVINSHLVFEGGKHTFKYGRNTGGDFGGGASDANPTILVTEGTTLDLVGKDLTGWDGAYNANGVIRVNDGGTLNFSAYNGNTIYYRQRLVIDPGATVNVPENDRFRLYGGASGDTILVPANGGEKVATLNGTIGLYKDGTTGFGINVGSGSKLQLNGKIQQGNAKNYQFAKRGAGTLSGLQIDGDTTIVNNITKLDGVKILSGTTIHMGGDRTLLGTTEIAAGATLDLRGNDIFGYENVATMIVKGTLKLNRARQTVKNPSNGLNTIILHPGARIEGDMPAEGADVNGGCHLNVFQNTVFKMVKDNGEEGDTATINAILGPQGSNGMTVEVAAGLTLELTTPTSSSGAGRQDGLTKTGAGTLKIAETANISTLAALKITEGVITVVEGASIPSAGVTLVPVEGRVLRTEEGEGFTTYRAVQTYTVTLGVPDDERVKAQYKIGSGEWVDYTEPVVVDDDHSLYFQYVSTDSEQWTVAYSVSGLQYTHIHGNKSYTFDNSKLAVTDVAPAVTQEQVEESVADLSAAIVDLINGAENAAITTLNGVTYTITGATTLEGLADSTAKTTITGNGTEKSVTLPDVGETTSAFYKVEATTAK